MLQGAKQYGVIDLQAITRPTAMHKVGTIVFQNIVQRGDVGAHGSGGNSKALRQLFLWQSL
ncbi:hypothetical protein D3C81_1028920 [compost metagenome]